jgi:hypothetical protein
MTEEHKFANIKEQSQADILDFFLAANASLVKNKLEKYGLGDEEGKPTGSSTRRHTLDHMRLGFRRISGDLTKNPFKSRLQGRCFWRKSN